MNVIKDVTFEGTILDQVRRTIDYLETQVREYSFLGEHGQFVTKRNYSKFAIQELVVNSVCHRDYSIAGTEIQIKMFDNRIVFETPGRLPGLVRPENIRHTHFSRNSKIALFLKAYKFVKEFGEGIDCICTELEQTGTPLLNFNPNYFILQTTLFEEEIITPESAVKESDAPVTDQTGHETGHDAGHETGHVVRLINTIGEMTLTRPEIMAKLELKGRGNFLANYLYPAISGGYVAMKYPEAEKRKDQAYYLTKKGKDLYQIIMTKRFPQDY